MLYQTVVCLVVTLIGLIRKFCPRLQKLSQIVEPPPGTLIGRDAFRSPRQRHRNGSLENSGKKIAIRSGCEVEKYPLVPHLLELLVRHFVAMLDGISTGIDRGLEADPIDGMDGNLETVAMCLFDGGSKLRNGK